MKKETCPFCGHRWITTSRENPIHCPNCDEHFHEPPRFIDERVPTEW